MMLTAMRCLAALPRACRRGRAVRAAGAALALVALLPSVLPYDHLAPLAARGRGHDHEAQHAADAHEQHCHGNAASCSDAPAPAGSGQVTGAALLGVAPPAVAVPLYTPALALTGIARPPEVRPPVRALPLPV